MGSKSSIREVCRKILNSHIILCALKNRVAPRVSNGTVRVTVTGLCVFALFILCTHSTAFGQTCQASQLRVHVRDYQESPIYDVQVRVQGGTEQALQKDTGTSGTADFDNVPCGIYSVTASKQGFAEKTEAAEIGKTPVTEISVVLEPTMQHSEIEVKETAPKIEQSSSENNELRPSEMKP